MVHILFAFKKLVPHNASIMVKHPLGSLPLGGRVATVKPLVISLFFIPSTEKSPRVRELFLSVNLYSRLFLLHKDLLS